MPEKTVAVKVKQLEELQRNLGLAKAALLHQIFLLHSARSLVDIRIASKALPGGGNDLARLAKNKGVPRWLVKELDPELVRRPSARPTLVPGLRTCAPIRSSQRTAAVTLDGIVADLGKVLRFIGKTRDEVGGFSK